MQKLFSFRFTLLIFSLFFILLVLMWLSLFSFSAFPLDAMSVFKALSFENSNEGISEHIILDIRLPRVLVAAACGASLAAAGAIMQGITNNPLASPSILGINSGAAFGMAFVSTQSLYFGFFSTSFAALLGGAIAWGIVMIIGKSQSFGNENTRLVLAGVAISALCAALTKAFIILEEEQASGIMVWLAGTFAKANWQDFYYLSPFICIGLLGSILISPKLNLLQLGNEYAISLGISPKKYQILGSILVLIIVSGIISTVGSLGFIGLLVPHMARFIIGVDHRKFIPLSMLLGSILVVLADILSRAIIFPMETPAGAILALIGAPFFIYLVRKKG